MSVRVFTEPHVQSTEDSRRVKEANQLKLQEHLRGVYLQLMSDCKGLQRLKRVSWQRGVAVGTHSTFHIVRDATAGSRFVLKTMFVPSDVILRRLKVGMGHHAYMSHCNIVTEPLCDVVMW